MDRSTRMLEKHAFYSIVHLFTLPLGRGIADRDVSNSPRNLAEIAEIAERALLDGDPISKRADGSARSRGGVLFAVARQTAFELVKSGELGRRDFFRTFCWREPAPRKAKERLAAPVQAKTPPRPKPAMKPGGGGPRPGGAAPRGGRVAVAEVYTVVRGRR